MIKFNKEGWLRAVRVFHFRGIDPDLLLAALAMAAVVENDNDGERGEGLLADGDELLRRVLAQSSARCLRPRGKVPARRSWKAMGLGTR